MAFEQMSVVISFKLQHQQRREEEQIKHLELLGG